MKTAMTAATPKREVGDMAPTFDNKRNCSHEGFDSGLSDLPGRSKVGHPIQVSWQRSQAAAVPVDLTEPTFVDVRSRSTVLTRAAGPVVAKAAAELHNEPVTLIVTDAKGVVLLREGGDRQLLDRLDRVFLAPGFNYSESQVGTNGIGTTLEVGDSVKIDGTEHYTDTLRGFSCAGALVRHPLTGQVLGVVDLTTQSGISNPLLMSYAKLIATRIQEQLLDDSSALDRALLEDYHAACRHSGGAVIAVGGELFMMNPYLQRHFSADDRAAIIDQTEETRGRVGVSGVIPEFTRLAELPSGLSARLSYHPTIVKDTLAGIIVKIRENRAKTPTQVTARTPALPGVAGGSPQWLHAVQEILTAQGLREWLVVEGEPSVGKRTLLKAAHHNVHPNRRLSIVDARSVDDDVADGFRAALEAGDDLVVTHAHALSIDALDGLVEMLQEVSSDPADGPWVALTVSKEWQSEAAAARVIGFFPRTVHVPPLRHHLEDVPSLCRQLLDQSGATELTLTPQAIDQLKRLPWPGNVDHLREVLNAISRRRRSGLAGVEDLPPECRATTRRQLTAIEAMERDAIVEALALHDGDKAVAAGALGMSRATIYRKIRSYGIHS